MRLVLAAAAATEDDATDNTAQHRKGQSRLPSLSGDDSMRPPIAATAATEDDATGTMAWSARVFDYPHRRSGGDDHDQAFYVEWGCLWRPLCRATRCASASSTGRSQATPRRSQTARQAFRVVPCCLWLLNLISSTSRPCRRRRGARNPQTIAGGVTTLFRVVRCCLWLPVCPRDQPHPPGINPGLLGSTSRRFRRRDRPFPWFAPCCLGLPVGACGQLRARVNSPGCRTYQWTRITCDDTGRGPFTTGGLLEADRGP